MIFTSLNFLCFFSLLLFAVRIVASQKVKLNLLLFASLIFYGAWNLWFVPLLVLSSTIGWFLGQKIIASNSAGGKRFYLVLSIALGLGVLGFFKYANFFGANIAALMGMEWIILDIILPVGISFFTFQNLSYTIDLYRGTIKPCDSLSKYILFVSFFPQLVAGPIVRASEFLPQLDRDIQLKARNLLIGGQIFLGGAIQKVLIADNLSGFVDHIFSNPSLYSGGTLWLAMFAYSMQIFCDFSGYTLMAIGAARVFGFSLPENFRMPYISLSVTEFWRRWHISLSTWLRDYLYISLGGNRKGEFRTILNLFITMLLGGLWHGASWNFVVWGAFHGIGLGLHKYWVMFRASFLPGNWHLTLIWKLFSWILTLIFCCVLWIPFRSETFGNSVVYIARMFSFSDGVRWIHPDIILLLGISVCWHVLFALNSKILSGFPTMNPLSSRNISIFFSILLLILMFAPINSSPFVYFQF